MIYNSDSKSARSILYVTTALITGILLAPASPAAAADLTTPTGETVVGGSASFNRPAAGQLNVTQNTDRVFINWSSFDIGKDATTQFFQPNTSSLAVNRILNPNINPTQIFGTLKANGKVMILDPNGILFGNDSKVDVNGLVATTGQVSTAKVMSGAAKINIKHVRSTGIIENRGHITVADAGIAAFVAPEFRNSGVIAAKLGKVGVGAGTQVTVDLYGDDLISVAANSKLSHALIANSGKIAAEGGMVQMTARTASGIVDNAINNTGIVEADSMTVKGGEIILFSNGQINNSGTMAAHSAHAGGTIKMEGRNVDVSGTADAESSGDTGGHVDIAATSQAHVSGQVSVSGAARGGFIQINTHDIALDAPSGLLADSTAGRGGTINLSAGHLIAANGLISTIGDDGAGFTKITGHDFTLGQEAEIFSTSINGGTGGGVDVSAANVGILGNVSTAGFESGGKVKISGHDINMSGFLNDGSASGTGGELQLVAAHALDLSGIIDVHGGADGGHAKLSGHDIDLSGLIHADSTDTGVGGHIDLLATHNLDVSGLLTANGAQGGGIIRAAGSNTRAAHDITVETGASIFANSTGSVSGNGGNVSFDATHNIAINGDVQATGTTGGEITFHGQHNVTVGTAGDLLTRGNVKGGKIVLTAGHSALSNGLEMIDGAKGAGSFKIQGQNVSVAGFVDADGNITGNGGIVSLLGTLHNYFSGLITAKGGNASGDGGKVVIAEPNVITGTVDVSAPAGTEGIYIH